MIPRFVFGMCEVDASCAGWDEGQTVGPLKFLFCGSEERDPPTNSALNTDSLRFVTYSLGAPDDGGTTLLRNVGNYLQSTRRSVPEYLICSRQWYYTFWRHFECSEHWFDFLHLLVLLSVWLTVTRNSCCCRPSWSVGESCVSFVPDHSSFGAHCSVLVTVHIVPF
jgi:hypothetical protein